MWFNWRINSKPNDETATGVSENVVNLLLSKLAVRLRVDVEVSSL